MKKDIVSGLAWGGGIVVLALAAKFAAARGLIDNNTAERLVFGAIGLMVAWSGNSIPKKVVPSTCARRAARVSGWAMVLSGLRLRGKAKAV
jgi:ribosomal protein S9